MATFKDSKKHDINPRHHSAALTAALSAVTLLNKTILPDHPENYISQYQLDIIVNALGIDKVGSVSCEVVAEPKYPIMMEFPLAIEGCRAGLYQLQAFLHSF